VNPASLKSHQTYCERKGFGFPILSDPGGEVTARFQCRKPSGKGVLRTVYALDTEGKVIFAERGQADLGKVSQLIAAQRS